MAVAGAAGQRLGSFQTYATGGIGLEIKSANVREDFLVAVTRGEFAEAASLVVDAEFKAVAGPWLDEIVDKILGIFVRHAFCCLLAEQGLVLPRQELMSRSEPF